MYKQGSKGQDKARQASGSVRAAGGLEGSREAAGGFRREARFGMGVDWVALFCSVLCSFLCFGLGYGRCADNSSFKGSGEATVTPPDSDSARVKDPRTMLEASNDVPQTQCQRIGCNLSAVLVP